MTRKRFKVTAFDTLYITDIINHKDYALNEYEKDAIKLTELLNKFHMETTNYDKALQDKITENTELKKENSDLRITLTHIKKEFRERGILTEEEFLELIK